MRYCRIGVRLKIIATELWKRSLALKTPKPMSVIMHLPWMPKEIYTGKKQSI